MKKFDIFCSNLAVLSNAYAENLENEFIISGIIDKFFIQFELGWKVLKEFGNEAKELVKTIIDTYIPAYCRMKEEIEKRYLEILDTL
ncbi:MAG: hypothetical protein J6J42_10000 [Lachnospiraceae bacterium]|nr:hypothetical protein [Lachnospiraceae bacterium]